MTLLRSQSILFDGRGYQREFVRVWPRVGLWSAYSDQRSRDLCLLYAYDVYYEQFVNILKYLKILAHQKGPALTPRFVVWCSIRELPVRVMRSCGRVLLICSLRERKSCPVSVWSAGKPIGPASREWRSPPTAPGRRRGRGRRAARVPSAASVTDAVRWARSGSNGKDGVSVKRRVDRADRPGRAYQPP